MNVVTGDATGLLKVVNLKTNGLIKRMGTQEASRGGITAMCWAGAVHPEAEVAIALSQGNIEIWNTASEELTASMQGLELHGKTDRYVGLQVLRSNEPLSATNRSLLTVSHHGSASISPWLPYIPDIKQEEDDLDNPSLTNAQKSLLKKKRAQKHAKAILARQEAYDTQTTQWKIGSNIENIRLAPALDVFAAGGKENRFKLWDLETQKPVYSSRQLPNDFLNMSVPNWDLDFAFICSQGGADGSEDGVSNEVPFANRNINTSDYKIATTTNYRQVRIYDVKAGGRPQLHHALEENARSIASTRDGNYVIIGDVGGRVQKLDIRKNLQQVGVMKGSCGSIRQIKLHPSLNMVATVSLDRHLRVHDLDTRKLLKEVYLKQKMTTCLFSSITPGKNARSTVVNISGKKEEDADDIDEEIWKVLGSHTKRSTELKSRVADDSVIVKQEDYPVKTEHAGDSMDDTEDDEDEDEDDDDLALPLGNEDEDDEDDDSENDNDLDLDEDEYGEMDFDENDELNMMRLFAALGEGEEGDLDFLNFDYEGDDDNELDLDEDDLDEDEDEDDDEDDEFDFSSSSFVILGANGKPISSGGATPQATKSAKQPVQSTKSQPAPSKSSLKTAPPQQQMTSPSKSRPKVTFAARHDESPAPKGKQRPPPTPAPSKRKTPSTTMGSTPAKKADNSKRTRR